MRGTSERTIHAESAEQGLSSACGREKDSAKDTYMQYDGHKNRQGASERHGNEHDLVLME